MRRQIAIVFALLGVCFSALGCSPQSHPPHNVIVQQKPKPEIFAQLGHSEDIRAIAFSPDGSLLVSGGEDHAIVLWDVKGGRELRRLEGHAKDVLAVAFSLDGKTLASASLDDTIRLWNPATGALLRTLDAQSGGVLSIAFSPDGKRLASGGFDWHVKLWDLVRGGAPRILFGHSGAVTSLAFSPHGTELVSGSDDKTVRLWDATQGRALQTLVGHKDAVNAVAFSPDGTRVASGSDDHTIKIWDTRRGIEQHSAFKPWSAPDGPNLFMDNNNTDSVEALAFSPDGSVLASGGNDKIVRLWDVASGGQLRALDGHAGRVLSVAISRDGNLLASGSEDKTVRLWQLPGLRALPTLAGNTSGINSVALSRDGKLLASGSNDFTTHLWDMTNGHELRRIGEPFSVLPWRGLGRTLFAGGLSVAFSPDGSRLAAGNWDETIGLWDVASGHKVREFRGQNQLVAALAFSPNGKLLASGSSDMTIMLWDAQSGGVLRALRGHDDAINALAFSPDGTLLASGSADKTIRLWNVANGELLRTLRSNADAIHALAFSPDGSLLAAGSAGGWLYAGNQRTLKLWDVASAREPRVLAGHFETVNAVAFSPDGKSLASGGDDHTIRLWDVASGQSLRILRGHDAAITGLAFAPDGKTLISGSRDGSTRIWDVATGRARASEIGFTDGSSIAVTPEGFFDSSSERAEENLNVRIGNRVFGISSFREYFYRPDLVKLGLAGTPLAQFGSIDTVKLSPAIELAGVPQTTTKSVLDLTLHLADGGGGFGVVRIFWNGTVVKQDSAVPSSGDTLQRSYRVPLLGGDNILRATASNADGSMFSDASTSVSANLPAPAKLAGAHGTLHAVVVGIQNFPNAPRNNLTYPAADAKLIAQTLNDKARPLFTGLDIELLTPAQTDRTHVIQALKAMQSTVGPDDEFVFYVASHGIVAGGEYYLMTSDASAIDAAALAKHAISSRELSDLLANIPAAKKLVIIDTCDAGAMGDTLQRNHGLSARAAATILGRSFGLTVLAATTSNQQALEGGYRDHGLFTYVVNDGLAGRAADATSGIVSSFLLADYVDSQVPLLASAALHREQQPTAEKNGQTFAVTKVK